MKYLKILFLIAFIFIFSSNVFALNLEVDNDLSDFAQENLLKEDEIKILKDPFYIKKEVVESPVKENKAESLLNSDENIHNDRIKTIEKKESEPDIIINGVISASNSRIALLISYQQQKHLLKIGDSFNDYRLTAYKNGKAIFKKNDKIFEIIY